jgi:tRNA A-37 threonylcarbamoyl transferase component Bud32
MALPLLALRCRHCDHHAQALPGARCPTDGHFLVASTADPLVGRELAPDLVLFDVLSDGGGFSRVYRAVQLRLAREVVVKVLRPQQAEVALGRARFLQEARLLAELGDEPRVVTVHDCGELGDLLYLVLARAPGEPLSVRLKHGPLPEAQAVALVGEVLLALTSVHARGQVHRDLKPDNIIVQDLTGRPQVTLIDFGIAKLLNSNEDSPRTATDVSLGTPRSMAPEQLQSGGEVGPWTDVYAVGVLLFELLTGHPPFEGSAAELVGAHLYQPPPELPGRYGPLVERALAKRPADRFADAAAMARALAAVGEVGAQASQIIALSPTLDAVEKVRGPRWRAERVTKERATATGWRSRAKHATPRWGAPRSGEQRSTRTLRVAAAVAVAALLAVVAALWPGGQPVGDALARLEPANVVAGQGGPANITAERGPGPADGAGQAAAALVGKVAAANPLNITGDRSRAPATVMGRPGLPADVTVEGAGAATLPADITAIPPAPGTAPPAPATTALGMAAPATNAPAPATAAPETRAPAPATAAKVPASPARVAGQPAKATAAPATAAPAARAPAPATAPPAKAPAAVKPARVAGQPPSAAPPSAAPPTATPHASLALIRRLREAVRTCACDRARALLAEAAQTTDHAALQTEVDRCRPKLPGLACRYEGP